MAAIAEWLMQTTQITANHCESMRITAIAVRRTNLSIQLLNLRPIINSMGVKNWHQPSTLMGHSCLAFTIVNTPIPKSDRDSTRQLQRHRKPSQD